MGLLCAEAGSNAIGSGRWGLRSVFCMRPNLARREFMYVQFPQKGTYLKKKVKKSEKSNYLTYGNHP
jgi:hypothetical protein